MLAQPLGVQDGPESREGLAPLDPVGPVARRLLAEAESGQDRRIALVDHLPFLDRLASRLVAGDEELQVIAFQMDGLLKLVPKQQREGFSVAWVLAPEVADG